MPKETVPVRDMPVRDMPAADDLDLFRGVRGPGGVLAHVFLLLRRDGIKGKGGCW